MVQISIGGDIIRTVNERRQRMPTVKGDKKITDMTVRELKALIRDTVLELLDPDYGLELRPEVEEELRASLKQKEKGEGIPLEEAKKQLGLK
jgi:hypothetical protein